MKNTVILLTIMFITHKCRAQYFFSGDYMPKPCFDGDPITIIDSISLTSLDHRIHDSISKNNDTIILHLCYLRPGGPQGIHRFSEKTNIGKLPIGKYVVKIEGVINFFGVCDSTPNFYNTIYFPLEVLAIPNSISEEPLSKITLKSSQVNENIHISSIPRNSTLSVYDFQGRLYYKDENAFGDFDINTRNWSNGFYVISVEVNKERKRWKVLKE
ncbi:MAG: T9SS type A sorting domain-containing protein [Chitinophagales bacterium]|nr:T9SS type A sorting domain-containing protein [Chitinophagales bacterium]